jgi:putative membrane protein insertion efficiency factor
MNPVTHSVLVLIRTYRKIFSPDQGLIKKIIPLQGACIMYPTCSIYMEEAILKYGLIKGLFRGFRRILRCHPYQKKLIDLP